MFVFSPPRATKRGTVARGNVLYKTLAEVQNVWSKNTKKPEKFVISERLWMLFKTLFKH
jgi:hypothetical protein